MDACRVRHRHVYLDCLRCAYNVSNLAFHTNIVLLERFHNHIEIRSRRHWFRTRMNGWGRRRRHWEFYFIASCNLSIIVFILILILLNWTRRPHVFLLHYILDHIIFKSIFLFKSIFQRHIQCNHSAMQQQIHNAMKEES